MINISSLYYRKYNSYIFEIALIAVFLFLVYSLERNHDTQAYSFSSQTIQSELQSNVHERYYESNKTRLEYRFAYRKYNDPFAYINQVLLVFGSAIFFISILMKNLRLSRSFSEVSGWSVTILCCTLNLIFAYAFGFVAVVNDWWFFFPDLITKHFWQIKNGQMVLGDVLFYPMATIMGHITILLTVRMSNPLHRSDIDSILKSVWFIILFTITMFGITFGSKVMQGMILWLYLPFGLAGLLIYKRITAFQLWSVTVLFLVCEFLWDIYARINGIWIFPDSSTHPGLYFKELHLFNIAQYPVIWQPEMTQMAFVSGMICLVFFHLARYLLNKRNPEILIS